MPTYGQTPSTLHIPHCTTPITHVSACFAAAARRLCIVGQIEPTPISHAADALPSMALVQIGIYMPYLCISAEVQIRVLLVCGVVEGGGGLSVRRHSYGGHRVV